MIIRKQEFWSYSRKVMLYINYLVNGLVQGHQSACFALSKILRSPPNTMPFFNCECYHKWGRPNDLLVFVFQALIWMSFVKVSIVCSTFCSWILLSIITVGPLQCVISNIMVWFLCHRWDYNPSKLFGTPLDYFVTETGELTLIGKREESKAGLWFFQSLNELLKMKRNAVWSQDLHTNGRKHRLQD